MADWPKKLSREALRDIISQVIWSYWPLWGAPLMGSVLAYVGGYPLTVIFMVALGAFALISLSLNNFAQWRGSQSAAGKVDFIAPTIGAKHNDADPTQLQGLKLGVALRSTAIFPMEIRIDDLETQIADRVPNEAFLVRSATITQGMFAQFTNSVIDIAALDRVSQTIHGHINATVSYGRPGRLKYTAERQWYMAFKFDNKGNLQLAEPSLTAFTKQNGA